MARLYRQGAATGPDTIAGAWLSFVAGLPIELLKILLNRRKLGTLTHPFCSWHSGGLTSLVALAFEMLQGHDAISLSTARQERMPRLTEVSSADKKVLRVASRNEGIRSWQS